MEDFIVMVLAAIFMFSLICAVVPLLWAESPILFVCAIVGGLIMSWLNGDWD